MKYLLCLWFFNANGLIHNDDVIIIIIIIVLSLSLSLSLFSAPVCNAYSKVVSLTPGPSLRNTVLTACLWVWSRLLCLSFRIAFDLYTCIHSDLVILMVLINLSFTKHQKWEKLHILKLYYLWVLGASWAWADCFLSSFLHNPRWWKDRDKDRWWKGSKENANGSTQRSVCERPADIPQCHG